jgi:hypothetical protein
MARARMKTSRLQVTGELATNLIHFVHQFELLADVKEIEPGSYEIWCDADTLECLRAFVKGWNFGQAQMMKASVAKGAK